MKTIASHSPKSARERVIRHLLEEFDRLDLPVGARLAPSRSLAGTLGVSVSTVQAAFRDLASAGKIRTEVGNGSFLIVPGRGGGASTDRPVRVLLAFPGPRAEGEAATWSQRIVAGIMQASSQAGRRISYTMMGIDAADRPEAVVASMREQADAVVLPPVERVAAIAQALEESGIPVVCFNAPGFSSTSNFVSPDYFSAGFRLGECWKATGRRRIALIGTPGASASNLQRLAGLTAGIGANPDGVVSCRVAEAPDTSQEAGFAIARELYRKGGWHPDAIHCMGDLQAAGVLRYLDSRRIAVPGAVSVVGGSGLDVDLSPEIKLTTMNQAFAQVGEAMVDLLIARLSRNGASMPGRYIVPSFVLGGTTTVEENRLLRGQ